MIDETPDQAKYHRRAAALVVHMLDDNDDGIRAVMMDTLEEGEYSIVRLPMAVVTLLTDEFPHLLGRVGNLRERLLEYARIEASGD
ncbi:hypothetical protein [Prescottella equi]|uniref:hypothetical protein n=1 Tax=Rhodococcus hoagii TaxID=43767 RepID=UPI001A098A87|nr:hypothetical protein [Prescottella equi]NKS00165.1 hypothetical protein [Prescottella equi]NKZ73536.1 hypothetical protein [Prescottella equi]